jgi:integrase
MVGLGRAADGRWFARKAIPEDVREEYKRLYGHKREAQLKLPANTPKHEAKTRLGEWSAEIETRIATLRAQRNGEGQPLTRINAIALAGRWYNWFVKQYEDDPGPARHWKLCGEHFIDVLLSAAPDEYHEDRQLAEGWEHTPEVREAVRPQVAELARVATFLASEGKALDTSAYALFVDAVSDNLLSAITLLERRANGDYSRDDTPDSFPPFTDGPARAAGVSCWELFEGYVTATKPAPNTVSRWKPVFLEMEREFAEVGADRITEDAARKWMHGLITETRTAGTVHNVWLTASRTVFSWARKHKRISQNPFKEVTVDVPRRTQTREGGRSFTDAEAKTILKASLTYEKPTTPTQRARRWVPWLCAYSGARAGEITQLRGRDIEDRNGVCVMVLTPDAGTVKTGETRTVPLHEHIIEQGFMEMVRQVGKGPLFYSDATPQHVSSDPLRPTRRRADSARARLGEWVRELGVDDPEISPNHGWRHLFKRIADRCGIPEKAHDYITGHKHATEGRGYGAPDVAEKAAELRKFPHYKLD